MKYMASEKNRRGISRKESSTELTIVSVVFENRPFLVRNFELAGQLNQGATLRWLLVDNSVVPGEWNDLPDSVQIIPGAKKENGYDNGSRHHAKGIELALPAVTSRFLLFLDPDFFVVYKDWIPVLLRHMKQQGLGIFGAVWHPRWYFQYRYFPSVHFMLIDTGRIPISALNLQPGIDDDIWWQWINDDRVPIPEKLRATLKATRIRDTGWEVYRRYKADPDVKREMLVPHFVPESNFRMWVEQLLPEAWCTYPKDRCSYTSESFLKIAHREAYKAGWEEFFWNRDPFAVHLRRVGRAWSRGGTEGDMAMLDDFLARYAADTR